MRKPSFASRCYLQVFMYCHFKYYFTLLLLLLPLGLKAESRFQQAELERLYRYSEVVRDGFYQDNSLKKINSILEQMGLFREKSDLFFLVEHYINPEPDNNSQAIEYCRDSQLWKKLENSSFELFAYYWPWCLYQLYTVNQPPKQRALSQQYFSELTKLQQKALLSKNSELYVNITSELAIDFARQGDYLNSILEFQKVLDDIKPFGEVQGLDPIYLELALEWMSDSYIELQAYDEAISITLKLLTLSKANPHLGLRLYPYINLINAYRNLANFEEANRFAIEALSKTLLLKDTFDYDYQVSLLLLNIASLPNAQQLFEQNSQIQTILKKQSLLDFANRELIHGNRIKVLTAIVKALQYTLSQKFELAQNIIEETIPDIAVLTLGQQQQVYELLSSISNMIGDFKLAYRYQAVANETSVRKSNSIFSSIPDLALRTKNNTSAVMVELMEETVKRQDLELATKHAESKVVALLIFILLSAIVLLFYRQKKLINLATTDSLTGTCTRRAIFPDIELALKDKRTNSVIAMIDIDHFKNLNDQFGHAFGDEVLSYFGKLISNRIRVTDKVARYGGEEFLILLNNTNQRFAEQMIDSIRESLKANTSWESTKEKVTVNFSCGLLEIKGNLTSNEAIKEADTLLYQAKHLGRSQTVSAILK